MNIDHLRQRHVTSSKPFRTPCDNWKSWAKSLSPRMKRPNPATLLSDDVDLNAERHMDLTSPFQLSNLRNGVLKNCIGQVHIKEVKDDTDSIDSSSTRDHETEDERFYATHPLSQPFCKEQDQPKRAFKRGKSNFYPSLCKNPGSVCFSSKPVQTPVDNRTWLTSDPEIQNLDFARHPIRLPKNDSIFNKDYQETRNVFSPMESFTSTASIILEQERLWNSFKREETGQKGRETTTHPAPFEETITDFQMNSNDFNIQFDQKLPIPSYYQSGSSGNPGVFNLHGRKMKIVSQSQVEQAWRQGEGILVKCVGCNKNLIITANVKAVYCPLCGILASTEAVSAGRGRRLPVPRK